MNSGPCYLVDVWNLGNLVGPFADEALAENYIETAVILGVAGTGTYKIAYAKPVPFTYLDNYNVVQMLKNLMARF